MNRKLENFFDFWLPLLGVLATIWLVGWMFVGVLFTPRIVESPCPSGAAREQRFEDWHMAGPWPMATDYKCKEES